MTGGTTPWDVIWKELLDWLKACDKTKVASELGHHTVEKLSVVLNFIFANSNYAMQQLLEKKGITKPFDNPALEETEEIRDELMRKKFQRRTPNEEQAMSTTERNNYKREMEEFELRCKALVRANESAEKRMENDCEQYQKIAKNTHIVNTAKNVVGTTMIGGFLGYWIKDYSWVPNWLRGTKTVVACATGGAALGALTGIHEFDEYRKNKEWLNEETRRIKNELQKNELTVGRMMDLVEEWRKSVDQFNEKQIQIVKV